MTNVNWFSTVALQKTAKTSWVRSYAKYSIMSSFQLMLDCRTIENARVTSLNDELSVFR